MADLAVAHGPEDVAEARADVEVDLVPDAAAEEGVVDLGVKIEQTPTDLAVAAEGDLGLDVKIRPWCF